MLVDPQQLIAHYGYVAVGTVVGLESVGIPLPGETTLVAAAIFAGATHDLNIALVVAAATAGAVIGDNIGFAIGRSLGFRFLVRHGGRVGLDEGRIKLGQYLFRRHGGKVVFLGRFVALLRVLAAFLAGVNCMAWPRFLVFNFLGGAAWATVFGLGGYLFGKEIERVAGPAGLALLALVQVQAACCARGSASGQR
jgi:membrane protein DedA with SNARE-associated domain